MLKWKRVSSGTLTLNAEVLVDMLSGMSGKNRIIKKISFTPTQYKFLRVYRDAEQIVDYNSYTLTGEYPVLDMDLPVSEGQSVKVGFYNSSGATTAIEIMIGYEEAA
ncbi:hypothetical protein LCGC14_1611480 [marine sediment metagenome]|uniref:Uncharacterized protein n=1 Tax=marine sediment metagenome TaxID=412755 RepID=A0A0F9I8E9_9ZZZZ